VAERNRIGRESCENVFVELFHIDEDGSCQVRVYSGRGSGQVQTKTDEGQGQRAGLGISPAGVETDWIQQQRGRALIPCVGSGQGDGVGDRGGDRQRLE